VVFSTQSFANDIFTDIGHDGQMNRVMFSRHKNKNFVEISQSNRILGKFDNLIVNEPSLSSTIIPMSGGGIAIYADSDGSRNKFHLLVPVYKTKNRLYINCIYKTVYDSVDEKKSVGTTCQNQNLDQFDLSSAINEKDIFTFDASHDWLEKLSLKSCKNPEGFIYGNYYIVRCDSNREGNSEASTTVFKRSGEIVFSVTGYNFIPNIDGDKFILNSDSFEKTILFSGALSCFDFNPQHMPSPSTARLGINSNIHYSVENGGRCYVGSYSYVQNGVPIRLIGQRDGGMYYLLEQGENKVSTGLFILDKLDGKMNGMWIGSTPRKYLSVN
jgi:hypothetical protein